MIKVKLIPTVLRQEGAAWLLLPEAVLKELGWAVDDEVVLDIPTVHSDQIIVYKANKRDVVLEQKPCGMVHEGPCNVACGY